MRTAFATVLFALLFGCGSALPAEAPAAHAPKSATYPEPPIPPDPPPLAAFGDDDSSFQLDVRADAVVGRIGAELATLNRGLELARNDEDIVKALCFADKGVELSVLERRARDTRNAVRSALLEDDEAAHAAFRELRELEARSLELAAEGNQCLGENVGFVGDAEERRRAAFSLRDSFLAAPPVAKPSPIAGTVPQESAGAPAPGVKPTGQPHDASKLIRTAALQLAVFEVEKKLASVEQIAKHAGGYLSLRADREITVRVPRERFDETLALIERLGDVLHRAISAEDVTDQHVDLELRLRNALAVRERLEKLLEKASVTDAIQIQKELAKTTEEVERLKGKLELYRDRIAYSTITIAFHESKPERIRSRALLPFPWMRALGLGPLLEVPR